MKAKMMVLMWFIAMMTGCVPHHHHTDYPDYPYHSQYISASNSKEREIIQQRIYEQEDAEDHAEQAGALTGALFGFFALPFIAFIWF